MTPSGVILAKAGIQSIPEKSLDSCLRRNDGAQL